MTTVSDSFDRRRLLNWGSQGLVATAVAHLLQSDTSTQSANPGFAPRARRAIQISLVGGMSHVDSFDHKPELDRHHGQSLKTDETPDIFFGRVGLLRRSDWAFKQRGESGLWISDMFPHIAEMADELTLLRSLVSDSANHTPALFLLNSGFGANGFPSTGSWISYGLGKPSTKCRPLAMIGPVMEHPNPRVDDQVNRVVGTVGRTIVNEEHLENQRFFEDPSDALLHMVDLVEARDDDREAADPGRLTDHCWNRYQAKS